MIVGNIGPSEVPAFGPTLVDLYRHLDRLGAALLEACAAYLDEPAQRFVDMTTDSDTIVRVLYYPPLPPSTPPGAVRSAAHEDINLITLLSAATAEGLELLRHDGTWMPVHTGFDTIVVDAGDMLQNVTNGLFKSTTHRVRNPADATSERFSMPCFVHARREVDLSPLPSCIQRTGGTARYPRVTAGEYLAQRLREIGLG
jgi:isopenicillin N synthase-like dioxygenase